MKSLLRYSFLLFIGMILATACQKIEADTTNQEKPVVEGYLTADHPVSVRVTNEVLFTDVDTARGITGLQMQVSVDGQNYPMTEDLYGVYRANSLLVDKSKIYSMQFDYNGKTISSSTTIPGKPVNYKMITTDTSKTTVPHPSDSIMYIKQFNSGSGTFPAQPLPMQLTWDNPDQSYYLIVVQNIETNPEPINTAPVERTFILRGNPIQTNIFLLRSRVFQYYGRHWIILHKINAEYAALYQNNGSSSLTIKTPYTNISNGLGIFTGVNSDTVMLRIKKG